MTQIKDDAKDGGFVWLNELPNGINSYAFFISQLKSESKVYPLILSKKIMNTLYLSTLVRIKRDNKWYLVHCAESIMVRPDSEIESTENIYKQLLKSIHLVQNLYKITGKYEDIDKCQLDEEDRLKKVMPHIFS